MDRSWETSCLAALLFALAGGVAGVRTCAGSRPRIRAESSGAASASADLRWQIDLRTAQDCELRLLPGVGPSRAAAIRRARDEHGAFRRWEDLESVEGLGPIRIEAIRNGPVLPLEETRP